MAEAADLRGGVVRRIYANLGLLLGGKATAGVLSLAYLAVAARALGPTDYGVLVLVHAYTVTVGGIVNFPGWHAVVRFGGQAAAAGDRSRMVRLLRLTTAVELAAAAVAVAVAASLAPWIGPKLGWSARALSFSGLYSLAVLASARSTPAGYLQLRRRYDLLGAHNAVAPLVRLAGSVMAAAAGAGLAGFLWVWLLAALCEWLALWIMGFVVARRDLAAHRLIGGLRGVGAENPGLWRFMLGANSDVTFGELAGRLAPLAVGWVLGPTSAGFYAVAQRASTVISQPALVLGQAAYAELAALAIGPDAPLRLRRAVLRCIGVALLAALPVLVGILFFAHDLARLLAGPAYVGAGMVVAWLALSRFVLLAAPPSSAALVAMGKPGRSVTANLAASLGLFPLLVMLMLRFGLLGAGIHAVIQAVVVGGLLLGLVWRETVSAAAPRPR